MTTSTIRNALFGTTLLALHAAIGIENAAAATFELTGTVTSCTPTCNSFAFLGPDPGDPTDAASLLSGFITLDDAAIADGTWTGGDVTGLSITVLDPAKPLVGPSDPPDPIVDNPFTLDQSPDGGGIVVANGQAITNPRGTFPACVPPETTGCVTQSAGTTDGTTLNGGFMDFWLTTGVLAANGAVIHIDFTAGTFAVNIFENLIFVAGGILGDSRPIIAVPPTLTLPDTPIGEITVDDMHVTNAGTLPLLIEAVVSPLPPFGLDADGCSGQTLAPGDDCTLAVSFAPLVLGPAQGSVSISSNDPNQPVAVTTLSGLGVEEPALAILSPQIAGTIGRCINRTTGQQLGIPLNGAHGVACEGAGLVADASDELTLRIRGITQATVVAGRVSGMNLDGVHCANVTTGQIVSLVDRPGLTHDWHCGFLVLTPGDEVVVTLLGAAE